ncbi:MAG: hypothetical protein AAF604_17895 [Acidobacteriota bacterium]
MTRHSEADFLTYVDHHPELRLRQTFAPLFESARRLIPRVSNRTSSGDYGLQPWPLLLDAEQEQDLARTAVALTRLIRQIPWRFFAGDPERLRSFYSLSSDLLARLLMAEPTGADALLARGDFLETDDGFRCLELNFGNLGGLQYSAFAPLFETFPAYLELSRGGDRPWRHRDSLAPLFRHVLRHRRVEPRRRPYRLAIVTATGDSAYSPAGHPLPLYQKTLEETIRSTAPGEAIELLLLPHDELSFHRRRVHGRGHRLHGIVDLSDQDTGRELFQSFKAGYVDLYSSPVGMILGDKRNLALLSQGLESAALSPEERDLIATAVPWTRPVTRGEVDFRGELYDLEELVEEQREQLVLKAGESLGGRAVVIGPRVDQDTWSEACRKALAGGDWIVQEYVAARPRELQAGAAGSQPHDIVWGLFVFGDEFGGIWIRLAPRLASSGVLNRSQGATIGVPFFA